MSGKVNNNRLQETFRRMLLPQVFLTRYSSDYFKIISYTRELSPQGCQQSPIYVKPKRS